MSWTRTDATRRWLVVLALIAGPALLALSNAFDIQGADDSMRAGFDAMTARPELLVVQSLLEAVGFMLALAGYAGATHALRGRGGALGTWGAALCFVGILGFSFSAANGFAFHALAQMRNHDAGFTAASAVAAGEPTGTIIAIAMFAGQAGIILVAAGLMRARLTRVWPLVLMVAGIVVNLAFGLILATLVADLLLLAASVWIAVVLARTTHEQWQGSKAATSSTVRASASV